MESLDGMQLFIDPEACIDCGACEPECPVEAIYDEDDAPEEYTKYIEINANFFKEQKNETYIKFIFNNVFIRLCNI